MGVVGPFGHVPSRTVPLDVAVAGSLPSCKVMLSLLSTVLRTSPTSHPASPWTSLLQLAPAVTMAVVHRLDETSPVPSPTFTTLVDPGGAEPGIHQEYG